MSRYLKVEGHDSLYRDSLSGAIINKSDSGYKKYIAQREKLTLKNNEIQKQSEEINNLKDELSDIKDMLKKLLEKQG